MRTTLTLEDDLEEKLREEARKSGRSFKDVVNGTLRRGLSVGNKPPAPRRKFTVEAVSRGFRPGIDLARLNQLVDEMEMDRFGVHTIRDGST